MWLATGSSIQTDRLTQLRPRREPHKNPKQRTLQPLTLNPSAVMVFSRCHRDVRVDASRRPKPSMHACIKHRRPEVIDVVKMTEAGVHRPVRALRGASAVDISADTSSRAAGSSGRGDQPERTRRCCGRRDSRFEF